LVVTSQDVGKVLRWDFERGIRDTSFSYKIECAQRKEVEVRIRIYDMGGNLVYEKRERKICPGTYSFTWDGTVNTGYLLDSLLECCCSPYYCCEGYDYSEGYEGGWGYEEGYGEGYDGAEGYDYTGECGEGEYGEGCEFSCGCCEGYEGEVGYDYSEDQTQFCYGNFQGGDEGLVCEDEVSQCGEGYDGDGGNIAPCGLIAPSGLYTFDVEVEFIPYDRDTVRSERMEVIAGPIEYLGYDDGGTPDDEEDDNYLYFLRVYTLRIYRNSRYGEIWLYGPELDMVWKWEVSVLRCVEHGGCKGLTASPSGERHGVIIPVPVKVMEKVGTYRFVLHFYDDYGDSYKDHQVKPALEVNAEVKRGKVLVVIIDSGCATTGEVAENEITEDDLKEALNIVRKIFDEYLKITTYVYVWSLIAPQTALGAFKLKPEQKKAIEEIENRTNKDPLVVTFGPIHGLGNLHAYFSKYSGSGKKDDPYGAKISINKIVEDLKDRGLFNPKDRVIQFLANCIIHELTHILTDGKCHNRSDPRCVFEREVDYDLFTKSISNPFKIGIPILFGFTLFGFKEPTETVSLPWHSVKEVNSILKRMQSEYRVEAWR
jgi:hypothetical protein